MSTDATHPGDDYVSITDVLGDKYDYHAMMNCDSSDMSTATSTEVTTIDGGAVSLNVGRTFYLDPAAPRWAITIIAEDVDEDEKDPAVAGHLCRCGDLHHHAGYGEDTEIITLAADAAVQLAREILRLAPPLQ